MTLYKATRSGTTGVTEQSEARPLDFASVIMSNYLDDAAPDMEPGDMIRVVVWEGTHRDVITLAAAVAEWAKPEQ